MHTTRSALRKVVIIGQGYVGLPLALRAVDVGYAVVGIDTDPARAAALRLGKSFIEDASDADLTAALSTGRYLPTHSYEDAADFDVAVVTVPTPLRDGGPDLSYLERACQSLSPHLAPGKCVVVESTTYPGTTENMVAPLLLEMTGLRAGDDYYLGFSPERIDPGNRRWSLRNTPKIVSGVNRASLDAIQSFYDTIVDRTVPVPSPREAELAKLVENTFRHVNIALVNELSVLARELDIDIWSTLEAAESKPFGFMRFNPGPGVGGHCLPIDPSYLAWEVRRRSGRACRFIDLANDVNTGMPRYVVSRTADMLNTDGKALKGSRVLLIGLTYKRDSSDARESPSATVAKMLVAAGCRVFAADPHVASHDIPEGVTMVQLSGEAAREADAVLILTDHSAFDLSVLVGLPVPVLDTRNSMRSYDAPNVIKL